MACFLYISSFFAIDAPLWKYGDPVEYGLIIVEGSATIGRKKVTHPNSRHNRRASTGAGGRRSSTGTLPSVDENPLEVTEIDAIHMVEHDRVLQKFSRNSEYSRLEECLKVISEEAKNNHGHESSRHESFRHESFRTRTFSNRSIHSTVRKDDRDRFVNKVLARLYARQAYTDGLIFSRGAFLSDTSRMISGDLAHISKSAGLRSSISMSSVDHYAQHTHTSTLMAGPDGCVAMVFPKSSLVPFLDSNPGVLLSLLGTKVLI